MSFLSAPPIGSWPWDLLTAHLMNKLAMYRVASKASCDTPLTDKELKDMMRAVLAFLRDMNITRRDAVEVVRAVDRKLWVQDGLLYTQAPDEEGVVHKLEWDDTAREEVEGSAVANGNMQETTEQELSQDEGSEADGEDSEDGNEEAGNDEDDDEDEAEEEDWGRELQVQRKYTYPRPAIATKNGFKTFIFHAPGNDESVTSAMSKAVSPVHFPSPSLPPASPLRNVQGLKLTTNNGDETARISFASNGLQVPEPVDFTRTISDLSLARRGESSSGTDQVEEELKLPSDIQDTDNGIDEDEEVVEERVKEEELIRFSKETERVGVIAELKHEKEEEAVKVDVRETTMNGDFARYHEKTDSSKPAPAPRHSQLTAFPVLSVTHSPTNGRKTPDRPPMTSKAESVTPFLKVRKNSADLTAITREVGPLEKVCFTKDLFGVFHDSHDGDDNGRIVTKAEIALIADLIRVCLVEAGFATAVYLDL